MTIVKLKRARNSLLSVFRLPPEILGDIFRWNVHRQTNFSRLPEKSHNFLFVCHHWFEVASCTPELWSFWGDNLRDWNKRYLRYPTAPLDLVFNGGRFTNHTLDDNLRGALRDRAVRDTVRTIHLTADESDVLDPIISPLAGWEGIRPSSVESVVVQDESDDTSVDMSDFLAYYRFPKLRRLKLENCTISSWDLLMSRTSVLTTLTLDIRYPSPNVTSSQVLSILDSNPLLRKLSLYECAVPGDNAGKLSQVSLPHLRGLALGGPTAHVLQLLHRLNHPGNMDSLILNLFDGAIEDISDSIGRYLQDYLRRRGRSQSGLGLYLSSEDIIEFRIEDVAGTDLSAPGPAWTNTIVEVVIHLDQIPPEDLLEEALLDLIAYVPRTEIVYFRTYGSPIPTEAMSAQLTYLRALYFEGTPLHVAFPKSNLDWDGIFPHLQHVTLDRVFLRRGDWTPLTTFLERLTSAGRQLDTLEIDVSYDMHPKVTEKIENAVREFRMIGTDIE